MLSTLGPATRTVFRSRWRALWWAAGVLLTAYCAVPAPDHDADDRTDPADQSARQPAPSPTSPWAKDPGAPGS